jgi:hypothetical protein
MVLQLFLGEKLIGSIPVNPEKSFHADYIAKKKELLIQQYKDEVITVIENPTFYLSAESTMGGTAKSYAQKNVATAIQSTERM